MVRDTFDGGLHWRRGWVEYIILKLGHMASDVATFAMKFVTRYWTS